jgi:molybdopterin-guanine dinucleotide biosynthesis protein A
VSDIGNAAITAVVLAGGSSSRFGSDKLAAMLDGRPLLHHALAAVAQVADRIVVVIAPEAPVPAVPVSLAHRVVFARDAVAHVGPLAGLAAGLTAGPVALPPTPSTPPATDVVIVVGGDMPSLVPAVLRLLAETLAAAPSLVALTIEAPGRARLPMAPGRAPLPMAIRPAAARSAIAAILASGGRRSLLALLESVPSSTLSSDAWRALDPAGVTLMDVDTPADLARP